MPELIGITEICERLNLTRDYVRDRLVKRVDFPRPSLALSQKCRRWNRDDFEAWLRSESKKQRR